MSDSIHYPNAPIVEAIFAIDAPVRVDFSTEALLETVRGLIDPERFPEMHPIYKADFTFRSDHQTGETTSSGGTNLAGVSFESEALKQVLQFRDNGMSVHQLAPYSSHEEVIPAVQEWWKVFTELCAVKATTRQSLRFINQIQLPEAVGIAEVSEFAKITPTFALEDELEPSSLLSRVQLKDPASGSEAVVTFAIGDPTTQPLGLVFDLEVSKTESNGVTDDAIWSTFDSLRDLKNRLFCGSLHQKCLDLFN